MSITPKGESIRKAVKWISEERKLNPAVNPSQLVGKAAVKFDLNPMEVEYLTKFVKGETS